MRLRKIGFVILSLVLLVSSLGFGAVLASANDEIIFDTSADGSAIREVYSVNQEITFPETIKVDYKGEQYDASNGIIIYPSGSAYNLSRHSLSEVGFYTIKYYFEAQGVKVTVNAKFEVNTPYYNFLNDDGSTVRYLPKMNGNENVENNGHNYYTGGLVVNLKEGNRFMFNKPLNLNDINNITYETSNITSVTAGMMGSLDNVELPELANKSNAYKLGDIDNLTGDDIVSDKSYVSNYLSVKSDGIIYLNHNKEVVVGGKTFSTKNVVFKLFAYDTGKAYLGEMHTRNKDVTEFCYDNLEVAQDANYYITEWHGAWEKANVSSATNQWMSRVQYVRLAVYYPEIDSDTGEAKVDADGNKIFQTLTEEEKVAITSLIFFHKQVYNRDADSLIVRITDCYDPTVFVEAVLSVAGAQGWNRARSSHQDERGFNPGHRDQSTFIQTMTFVDGVEYCAYLGYLGKVGSTYNSSRGSNGTGLSYDIVNDRIYEAPYNANNEQTAAKSMALLNNFSDSIVYKGNQFVGFTTGEVYLSFYAEGYQGSNATFIIHSVGDAGEEEIKNWEGKSYVDDIKPAVDTSFKTTDRNNVYAAVGETVKLPEINFYDINKYGDLAVRVYRNYDSEERTRVAVIDNAFKVDVADIYTVEYVQKDFNGNVSTYTINVVGVVNETNKSITIKTEKLTALNAGQTYTLPEYSFDTLNLADSIVLKITATNENETIVIDNNQRTFTPLYKGTYTIKYEFHDNFGINTFEYDVESSANVEAVYYDKLPSLPRYFIKGHKYSLSQALAFKFDTGAPVAKEAKMYFSFDGGEKTEIKNIDAAEITGTSSAKLIYELDNVQYITQDIPIIDVTCEKGIDMLKYFAGDIHYDDLDNSGKRIANVPIMSNARKGSTTIEFIQPIDYNTFTFKYQVRSEYSGFNRLGIRLSGVEVPTEQIFIEIVREYGADGVEQIKLYIDNEYVSVLSNFSFADISNKSITYTRLSSSLVIDSYSFPVVFDFTGTMCNLDIVLGDIYAEAGILVNTIMNQRISGTTYKDNGIPILSVDTSNGVYAVGEEITFKLPKFSDVLSQCDQSTFKMTVKSTDGDIAVTKDGIKMDGINNAIFDTHTIVTDKITTYHVRYEGADYSGNVIKFTYIFEVVDTIAPTIKLSGVSAGQTIKVKAGTYFEFRYEIFDDISTAANCLSSVVIIDDSQGNHSDNVGTKVPIYRPGKYTVRVCVEDEAGNLSYVDFHLIAA